eukprot:1374841-Pyramimonas_sp.AAC.2
MKGSAAAEGSPPAAGQATPTAPAPIANPPPLWSNPPPLWSNPPPRRGNPPPQRNAPGSPGPPRRIPPSARPLSGTPRRHFWSFPAARSAALRDARVMARVRFKTCTAKAGARTSLIIIIIYMLKWVDRFVVRASKSLKSTL